MDKYGAVILIDDVCSLISIWQSTSPEPCSCPRRSGCAVQQNQLRRTKLPGLRDDMLECPAVRTEISGVDTRSFLQSPEDKSTQKDFQRNYYISDTIQVHILCGRFLFKIFRNVLSCVLARQWQYSCHIIRTYKKFHLYWQYLCSHAIFLFKPIRKYPVQMHIQI